MTTIPRNIKVQFFQKKSCQSLALYAASLENIVGVESVTLCENGFLLCKLCKTDNLHTHQQIMGAVACVLSSCSHQITTGEKNDGK